MIKDDYIDPRARLVQSARDFANALNCQTPEEVAENNVAAAHGCAGVGCKV